MVVLRHLALITVGIAQALAQPPGYWKFSEAKQGEPHELSVLPSDDHHPDVTLRCVPGSGHVFLTFSVGQFSELETVQIGAARVLLPASYGDDPHWSEDVATVSLPAEHPIFFELERGKPLTVAGVTYPQAAETDRSHAKSFVRACNSHAFPNDTEGQERTWIVVVASYPSGIEGMRAAREHVARLEDSAACTEVWRAATSGLHAVAISGPVSRIEGTEAAKEAQRQGHAGAYAARANDWTRIRGGMC